MSNPVKAILLDRPAFEAWLGLQDPERAAEIREGLELEDRPQDLYLGLCIVIKQEEKTA